MGEKMICLQIEGNRFKPFQITTNRLIIIDDLSASMSLLTPHKVIGGQLMTLLGQYRFWPITFDRIEIETWERCQIVFLV